MNEKIIYQCIIGSHASGTNIATSDTDIKGVYQQSNTDILGFKYKQQIEVDKDTTYYEVKRFIELAASANPTILEMLFVDDQFIKINTPQFQILRDNRHLFLTKQCAQSFGGYALQQIKKATGLKKKMNWEKEKTIRKTPIDFCYITYTNVGISIQLTEFLRKNSFTQAYCGLASINHMPNCYSLYYDYNADFGSKSNTPEKYPSLGYRGIAFEDSNDIRLSSIPKDQQCQGILYYNKDAYSAHCSDYNQYQNWLDNRNQQRYVDTEEHGQQIDGKNLMHCMRLIDCGLEIASKGTFTVFRPDADKLLDIRHGKCNLEAIVLEAKEKLVEMDELFKISTLPSHLDMGMAHTLLTQIRR